MRVRRLDLTRYGKFTGKQVEFGPRSDGEPDLHVVYGLNEAGKSTALNAYLDLLFGIEEKSRYSFLHPYSTMEVGGVLEFDGEAHELRRVKARGASLLDPAGQPLSDLLLGRPLGSLRRADYTTMFSLDDETLEKGGEDILASKGEIGKLLFQASAGVGALSETLEQMAAAAEQIHRPRGQKTDIADLKRKLVDLKAQRDEIDVQASGYARLVEAVEEAQRSYDAAADELGKARREQAELQRLLQAEPPARRRAEADAALAEFGAAAEVPPGARNQLESLERQEAALMALDAELESEQRRLDDEIAGYDIDERLLALTPAMSELSDAIGRQDKADEDLKRRKAELSEGEAALRDLLRRLGQPEDADARHLVLPEAGAVRLRDLIEAHGRLDAARQTAGDEQAQAIARRADVAERLDAGGKGTGVAAALVATLEAALDRARQAEAPRRRAALEQQITERRGELTAALGRLTPWAGDATALDAITVPDARRLEQLRGAAMRLAEEEATRVREAREAHAAHDTARAEIVALTRKSGQIDDAGAEAARAERDAAWARHLAMLDRDTALAFEERMRALDELGTRRLERADELASLRLAEREAEEAEAAVAASESGLARQAATASTLDAELMAEWPAGLAGPDIALPAVRRIEVLERWAGLRTTALVAAAGLQALETDAARVAAETERLAAGLSDALRAVGQAQLPADFANLLTLADMVLRGLREAATRFAANEQALEQAERDVAQRIAMRARADAAFADWQSQWTAALAGTWLAAQPEPSAVRARLGLLSELSPVLRRTEDARHRVATMEADRRAFERLVSDLHAGLGESIVAEASLGAARALRERVDVAGRDAAQLRRAEKDRAEIERRRADLAMKREAHAAQRAELFAALGVMDGAAAASVIAGAEARARLLVQRDEAEADLRAAFDGAPIDACLERLAGFDRSVALDRAALLEARLGDLDAAGRERFAALSAARGRLEAVGGDDRVARIEAERRVVLLEIEERAMQFLRLRAGTLLATRALTAYRDAHRSSMLSRASEAFRQITRGAYTGLDTLGGTDTLIGLTAEGGSREAGAMSKGTRFQLYLALRLAGYQEFAKLRPAVPFLADDIMETFDEPRSEEVFRLLAEMGRIGQTIYFTHHRHLCDMARAVVPGVRVHEL